MAVDIAILYAPVGGGHRAAALALDEYARCMGLSTAVRDIFKLAPRCFGDVYSGAHKIGHGLFPGVYGRAYGSADHRDPLIDPIRCAWDNLLLAPVLAEIEKLQPSAVIGTHHLPLVVGACAKTESTCGEGRWRGD